MRNKGIDFNIIDKTTKKEHKVWANTLWKKKYIWKEGC